MEGSRRHHLGGRSEAREHGATGARRERPVTSFHLLLSYDVSSWAACVFGFLCLGFGFGYRDFLFIYYRKLPTVLPFKSATRVLVGGRQRPKIHHCGISRNRLTMKSSPIPAVSAVVAADWFRLDGGRET